MALKAVLSQDAYDGLDEAQKGAYHQGSDGSWILSIEGIDTHPSVRGLSNTLTKYRDIFPDANAAKALKERFDALESAWDGLDPEEVRTSLEKLGELEAGQPDVQAQVDRTKKAMEKAHEKELEKVRGEVEERDATIQEQSAYIERITIDAEIDRSLDKGDVLKEVRPGAKAYLRLTHQPKVQRVVDDETGKVSYRGVVKTAVGESAIPDFVAQWLTTDEARGYLPPTGNTGTGSGRGSGSGGGPRNINPWAKETRNLTEQVRISNENPALAEQFKKAAGVVQ